jgi:osmotically-inducible protein OsmY
MQPTTRNFFVLAAAAAVGITVSIILFMTVRHQRPAPEVAKRTHAEVATVDPASAIATRLRDTGLNVSGLKVSVVDGIAIVRGKVTSPEQIDAVGATVKALGFQRVANLVQKAEVADDAAIVRETERQLTTTAALDGCSFGVASKEGVVTVRGTIQHDAQRITVERLVKKVNGVSGVQLELSRS